MTIHERDELIIRAMAGTLDVAGQIQLAHEFREAIKMQLKMESVIHMLVKKLELADLG